LVKSSRSFNVSDNDEVRDSNPILRWHPVGFLFDCTWFIGASMVYTDRSQEISRNRAIPVATAHFVRTLKGAQASLQQEGVGLG
jgi:hypothetical protein